MSDLKVSPLIKSLSDNYVNNRISFDEYRSERQIILRQIDSEFNQRVFVNSQVEPDETTSGESLEASETIETPDEEDIIKHEKEVEEDPIV